jgi:hypothetical protein
VGRPFGFHPRVDLVFIGVAVAQFSLRIVKISA